MILKYKTAREHFEGLISPYKEKAINNYITLKGDVAIGFNRYPTLSRAIYGFNWSESPEGTRYWMEIHNDVRDNGNNSKYVDPFAGTYMNIPLWARSIDTIDAYIRETYKVNPEHNVVLLSKYYDTVLTTQQFINKYLKGELLDKSMNGYYTYRKPTTRTHAKACIIVKGNFKLIFRISIPKGATKEISPELKELMKNFKDALEKDKT